MFENQVRQLYVAKKRVASIADEGDIMLMKTPDAKSIYFKGKDKGGLFCTDKIEIDKIRDIVICKPVGTPIHSYNVTMNNAPVAGETYILRVVMRNIGGIDTYKVKEAVTFATTDSTKKSIYEALLNSFNKNFAREPQNPFNISLGGQSVEVKDGSDNVLGKFTALNSDVKVKLVAATTTADITVSTSNGVTTVQITPKTSEIDKTHIATLIAADDDAKDLITVDDIDNTNWPTSSDTVEAALPYDLVISDKDPMYRENLINMIPTESEVWCADINLNGGTTNPANNQPWGTVVKNVTYTGNARHTAMLERYAMKARGEMNGYIGYPQCDPAEVMINNPGINDDYWYLTIHYYFQGAGMANTNSEKEMVIVVSNTDEVTSNGVFAKKGSGSGSLTYGLSQISGTNVSNDAYTICSVSSNASILKDLNDLGLKSRLVKY